MVDKGLKAERILDASEIANSTICFAGTLKRVPYVFKIKT